MRPLLALLLRLFPAEFRERFATEIVEQVATDLARARARGAGATIAFALATGLDLLRSALAERWDPTWVRTSVRSDEVQGMGGMMRDWMKDFRHVLRSMRRSPGFAVVSVLTLGLAVGANAGIYSVVDRVLLDPLPYADSERLVYIAGSAPGSDLPEEFGLSIEFLVQYAEESTLLEDVAMYNSFTNTLRVDDRVERVRMSAPSLSLFATLGAEPILGRLPRPEDEDRVAVISHALWTTWFGQDPTVIGRSYYMGGADRTIVGVMGPEFAFPLDGTLLWIPVVIRPEEIVPGRLGSPLVGRLAPSATREGLVDELTRLARRLPERFGGSATYARMIEQHRPVVRPLEEELLGEIDGPLWLLFGAVGIVLLIACANVANLFIVRAEHRQRDLAVRRAIGAGRAQLVRGMLAESLVVAAMAGVLAVAIASVGVPAFVAAVPDGAPRLAGTEVTASTVLFTLLLSLLVALLCGAAPAVHASSPNLGRLRDRGRGSTRGRSRTRNALVVGQTSLALVLLIGSGLLIRSLEALRSVDPGYDTADLMTFQMAPEGAHLTDGPSWARLHMDFMDRIRALPGVESVGIVENVPLNEGVGSLRVMTSEMAGDEEAAALVYYTFAGGDYFSTMGIDVLRGRAFTDADHVSTLGNVVISESAAELLWPGENPLGRQLRRRDTEAWMTVVGVVDDVLQYGYRDTPAPMMYLPMVGPTPTSWWLSSPAYVVKSARAADLAPEIRALVREVAPEAPMYRVFTMEDLASGSMAALSFMMLTLGVASMLAMILGAIGLYGVLSYVVAGRTQEIGVRMALGAEAPNVRRMVVAQGARIVGVGIVIGVAVALAATRALEGLLYGVGALDVTTFLAMSGLMVLVGLLASYVPARRASSVDPIQSLRAG